MALAQNVNWRRATDVNGTIKSDALKKIPREERV